MWFKKKELTIKDLELLAKTFCDNGLAKIGVPMYEIVTRGTFQQLGALRKAVIEFENR